MTTANHNNINFNDLFEDAPALTRGGGKSQGMNTVKVYESRLSLKHQELKAGEKVLLKIVNNNQFKGLMFKVDRGGNRTLIDKGGGVVQLSLNQEAVNLMSSNYLEHKNGNECEEQELEQHDGVFFVKA